MNDPKHIYKSINFNINRKMIRLQYASASEELLHLLCFRIRFRNSSNVQSDCIAAFTSICCFRFFFLPDYPWFLVNSSTPHTKSTHPVFDVYDTKRPLRGRITTPDQDHYNILKRLNRSELRWDVCFLCFHSSTHSPTAPALFLFVAFISFHQRLSFSRTDPFPSSSRRLR